MIRTLLWKEYREHRATIVALVVFGVALLVYAHYFVPTDSAQSIPSPSVVAIAMVWLTGLIAGSQAFAGEVENRTIGWLDALPALRRSIGRSKIIFALLFTIVPAVIMFGLGWTLQWIGAEFRGDTAVLMLAAGLAGLGCGLLASTFARSALAAIGLAIFMQPLLYALWYLIAQLVYLFESDRFLRSSYQWSAVICIALPFLIAQRRFTRLDRLRAARVATTAERHGNSWRTLLWLTWRQNRAIGWMILSAGLVATVVLPIGRSMPIWPAIGLVFGIVAGVGVFGVDRPQEAFRFFGDRRVPPGRVWLVKAGFGLAVALAPALMQLAGAYIFTRFKMLDLSLNNMNETLNEFWRWITLDYVLLGPLYGFALGALLGLLCRKAFIAVILAAMLGAIVFAGWWPATVVGGVHLWQWPLPPLALLTLTYLLVRPWTTGRLGEWRIALGVLATALVAIGLMVGGIAYRVIEPPVRTPPFDVAAFEASLPTPEQNEAGRKLVHLFQQLRPELEKPLNEVILGGVHWHRRIPEPIEKGRWPLDDDDLNVKLDEFAAGPWFAELRAATALPLGMVDGLRPPLYGMEAQLNLPAITLGRLCVARSMQLSARKQPAEAFEAFFLALDLSRHLRNKASQSTFMQGEGIERMALPCLNSLIESAAANPDLLAGALARLTAHDRAVPAIADTLKLDYLNLIRNPAQTFRHGLAGNEVGLAQFAAESPIEAERTRRIADMMLAGTLRTTELSYPDAIRQMEIARQGAEQWRLGWIWTPPPGSDAAMQSAFRQANELGDHSVFRNGPYYEWLVIAYDMMERTARSAGRLQLALALYQLRHERPATALIELVPEIISEVPIDPYSTKPFGYRVSAGERLDWSPGWNDDSLRYRNIPAGTGIVWSVGGDGYDGGGRINGAFIWYSRNDSPERDRLFLVPRLAKP